MKAAVYYFTGTGNSLAVARDIAKSLEGELISIPSVIQQELVRTDAEVIGVVFPVYIWGMPLIVERFIKKLANLQDKYVFAITTYGGMPGATINFLAKVIESCGGRLAAGYAVHMPGNYTPMYGAIAPEKQERLFARWRSRVEEIADAVKNRRQGIRENSSFLVNLFFSHLVYRAGAPHIPKLDKDFYVDEKCNGCGACARIYPVKNVEISGGRPVWLGACEQCLACLQWCPKESIQYGKATARRRRYHHPDVTLDDIIKHAGD